MNHLSNKQITISVIVPIYNAEPFLDQALTSLSAQTYPFLEIICVNDGSTDSSLATMEKFSQQDTRFRIIDKQNEGYGASCNRGIQESSGEYIALFEPDDWIEGNMYQDMFDFMSSFNTTIDIVKTPYWRIWMPDTPAQKKLNCSYRSRVHPAKQPFTINESAHLLSHHPSIWTALYRKSFLEENDIRFREYPGAGWADNPFLIETLCQAQTIIYLDTPYYCYREETPEKAESFAKENPLLPFERWNEMLDILEKIGATDTAILRTHYSRGFTYASGVIEHVGVNSEELNHALDTMFSRMDSDIVFSFGEISPKMKALYAKSRQIPLPKINRFAYPWSLIKQGIYTARNLGFQGAWFKTRDYFKRRNARAGRS
jgi:glycosyltransferase involved in cell wall biosynthesis